MTDIYEAALKVIVLPEGTDISARCSCIWGRKTGEACVQAIPAGPGAVGSHLCDLPDNPGISPEDGDAMIMIPHRGPADDLVITGVVVPPTDDASPDNLLKRVKRYRYKECARICVFIREVCGPNLSRADYATPFESHRFFKSCVLPGLINTGSMDAVLNTGTVTGDVALGDNTRYITLSRPCRQF